MASVLTGICPDTSSSENLAVSATATLRKGEGRILKAGGLWIYDNEIASVNGDFKDGDILSVRDFDGFFLGYGFISSVKQVK